MVLIGVALSLSLHCAIAFPDEPLEFVPVPAGSKYVPQTLLKLVHSPEVQLELGITGDKLASFESELRKIDGPWWASRIKPEPEQRKLIETQEKSLIELLSKTIDDDKLARLKQIELQSQGTRIFARPDVGKVLQLTKTQAKRLAELYSNTDKAAKKLQTGSGAKVEDKKAMADAQAAIDAEPKGLVEVLTDKQKIGFGKLLGEPFDTVHLERVFPLAPELIDNGNWVVGDATELSKLKGRVVLVHFYAFQCHNCVANFGHYNRWHEELSSKGVTVIGIQTPETTPERNVELVRNAAKEKGFQFPVLVDPNRDNWDAWGNTLWPTVYVVDKNGYIRSWWQGELNWQGATGDKTIESLVEKLLAE